MKIPLKLLAVVLVLLVLNLQLCAQVLFGPAKNYTVGPTPYSVVVADVNGDGKPDLISANTGTNSLTVLTNDGSGGFTLAGVYTVGNRPFSVVAAM